MRYEVCRPVKPCRILLDLVDGARPPDEAADVELDVIRCGPAWMQKTPARRPRKEDARYRLLVVLEGELSFMHRTRSGIVAQGEYLLLDDAFASELAGKNGLTLASIVLPARTLATRLVSIGDHVGGRFRRDPEMTALLCDFVASIATLFRERRPPRAHALAAQIVNIVVLAVGSETRDDAAGVRASRYKLRKRVIEFIEARLCDDSLTPAKIACGCGISVSYMYALLRDEGLSLGNLLLKRRLELAYELLAADARGHRTIAEIAYEVGFKNVSHFSRSFSQHFSIAPRGVRDAGSVALAA